MNVSLMTEINELNSSTINAKGYVKGINKNKISP